MSKKNLDVIAKKAGVSIATVSRALNGLPGVSEDRVREIQKIVEEVGFEPKLRGRNQTKTKSSMTLGVCYNAVAIIVGGDGFLHAAEVFLKQVHPICQRFAEEGISVIIVTDGSSVDRLPKSVTDREIDGIFYFGDVDASVCEHLTNISSLWMTSHREHGKSFLLEGNRQAGVISAEYFSEHSLDSVFIMNPYGKGDVLDARCRACESRAKELGLSVKTYYGSAMPLDGDPQFWGELWAEVKADILASDGLFLPADLISASLYPFLLGNGFFDRPKVKVISCGGFTSYLRGLQPAPVTVDFGFDVVGRVAADQLLWLIRNPQVSREISVAINPVILEPQD